MGKLTQNLFLGLAILLVTACGSLGTQAVLNPTGSLNDNFLFPENSATKNDSSEIDEEDEVLAFADGSIVAFDEEGNIIASDNPSASFNNSSSENSQSADATYAYIPEANETESSSYEYDDSSLYNDIPATDSFDDSSNENSSTDSNTNNNPANDFSNSIDVTDQENPDASVDLNNDPLQELAHLPAPIAKTAPTPNTDIFDTDDSTDDDPDENNDCGDDNDDVLIIDDEGDDEESGNEFEDPFGGSPSSGNSGSNSDSVTVSTVDCGDEEAEMMEENASDSGFPTQNMQFEKRTDSELLIIQSQQNPKTGKWELADDYVIVAAEHDKSGKTSFKVDKALLNGTFSTKPAKHSKTHFILQIKNSF